MSRLRRGMLLVVLALLGACGIPEESDPRPIAEDRIPEALGGNPAPSVPIDTTQLGDEHPVYIVETDPVTEERQIVPFRVTFTEPTPEAMVKQVLDTRGEYFENKPQLSNLIPPDVTLVRYVDDTASGGATATLDLSDEWSVVVGETQSLAVAQLVYTVTELGTIDRVRFRDEEGQFFDVSTSQGEAKSVVTREDYRDLLAD